MPFEVTTLRRGVHLLRSITTAGLVMTTRHFTTEQDANDKKDELERHWAAHRKPTQDGVELREEVS